ncbi:hypothetical protein A1O1_08263 [Capronia coronata CBS 617.96]|uniref:Xylanolytic transcriptional activator regulatory domain-containing protein n=1 Tax=Capronia coronata CBS 617.96 TaxID=1182541 RepID=W9XSZ5_9EURO|nr:uncharacterized protein A1O1_08263 [Capronia coronata CBS 617.96]EXJ80121.1 hypothetical protein A1O1_08263 [Capronia coronata CBS 617.96]
MVELLHNKLLLRISMRFLCSQGLEATRATGPSVHRRCHVRTPEFKVNTKEYFGGSSAGSFINQVRTAVRQKLGLSNPGPTERHTLSTGQCSLGKQQENIDIILPARSKADQLLGIYWDSVYPLYPFVDQQETLFKYRALWDGHQQTEGDRLFVCLLNVIFALSCQLNGAIEAERREASARVYFQRAKALLDLWSSGSFQCVQVHLLLTQFFQSTNEPQQCWMMVGVAVRTAQSLGLHLPETTKQVSSPRRRELMRKIWHGCILMDRVTSMTYGRPPMISATLAAVVPRPLPIDEELLPQEEDQPAPDPTGPSILDFFVQTLELYEILFDVLVGFYSSSSGVDLSVDDIWARHLGPSAISSNSSILHVERRLIKWEAQLPPHLRLAETSPGVQSTSPFFRQAVILHQR